MKMNRLLPLAVIALAGLSLGSGCPTFPSLKDRLVDLAVGGSTTLTFQASGIINTYDDVGSEDLVGDVDLQKLLDDAGIKADDVVDVKLAGVSYRVSVPDPNAGRTIANATVQAGRGPGPGPGPTPTALITNFTQNVDAATNWTQAPLDPAGVALINGLLTDILTATKSHSSVVPNPVVTYHVHGESQPANVSTSFTWQLKLDLTIVGKIKVTIVS